mmetsp:Transcript_66693/g.168217  ORF Transcript_66693/g.168217 Transcript_66693/m.168217 type:complete len:310 (+) Transcript_66693:110-1039(+)
MHMSALASQTATKRGTNAPCEINLSYTTKAPGVWVSTGLTSNTNCCPSCCDVSSGKRRRDVPALQPKLPVSQGYFPRGGAAFRCACCVAAEACHTEPRAARLATPIQHCFATCPARLRRASHAEVVPCVFQGRAQQPQGLHCAGTRGHIIALYNHHQICRHNFQRLFRFAAHNCTLVLQRRLHQSRRELHNMWPSYNAQRAESRGRIHTLIYAAVSQSRCELRNQCPGSLGHTLADALVVVKRSLGELVNVWVCCEANKSQGLCSSATHKRIFVQQLPCKQFNLRLGCRAQRSEGLNRAPAQLDVPTFL